MEETTEKVIAAGYDKFPDYYNHAYKQEILCRNCGIKNSVYIRKGYLTRLKPFRGAEQDNLKHEMLCGSCSCRTLIFYTLEDTKRGNWKFTEDLEESNE